MPPKTVATRARRQAVVGRLTPAFGTLDHMVYFPKTAVVLACPASPFENEPIPTEVAVPLCLVKDSPQLQLGHLGET